MQVILTEQEYHALKNAKEVLSKSLRDEYQKQATSCLMEFTKEMDRLIREVNGDSREMFKNNPGVTFLIENWQKCLDKVTIKACS